MPSYEQLGLFYLGRQYDLEHAARRPEPLLYDSKDLLTHAVCVRHDGQRKDRTRHRAHRGSGDRRRAGPRDRSERRPVEPPADVSESLAGGLPAVDQRSEAATAGEPSDARAARQAATWKAGLAEWDQAPDRIARLRAAADVQVYTPGSRAGTPLALLGHSPRRPPGTTRTRQREWHSTASSLLTLAGVHRIGRRIRAR